MRDERSVDGHEAQILDQALSEKKPVERIACRGLRFHDRQNVVMIDCDELKPNSLHKLWEQRGGHARARVSPSRTLMAISQRLATLRMDRRFGVGDRRPALGAGKRVQPARRRRAIRTFVSSRSRTAHASRRSRKSSGKGASKSSAMRVTIARIPCFRLNAAMALTLSPPLLPMRDQVEDRLAVAGDDDRPHPFRRAAPTPSGGLLLP